MNENRIYPSRKATIKVSTIFSILLLIVLYAAFSSRFARARNKEGNIQSFITQDLIVLSIWVVLSAIAFYIMLKKNYYVLTNSAIVHHKLSQEVSYSFNNMLYLDEHYSDRHDTILFYLNNGKSVFLTPDKDGLLRKAISKNAKNLISRAEFHRKFPNIKL